MGSKFEKHLKQSDSAGCKYACSLNIITNIHMNLLIFYSIAETTILCPWTELN